jgi:glycosyltransferase involved in cell wall biosynthesis
MVNSLVSKVSTIVPAYNAAGFIAEAIESVLSQLQPPMEIIVVDDGSTDDTARIAKGFPAVTVLSQENAGQGAARNRGVEAARGEFLSFIDADDLWTSDKLECQLAAMDADPQLKIVFGLAEEFRDSREVSARDLKPATSGRPRPAHLPGAMLIRREDFRSIGPYRTDLAVAEVVEWYGRAIHLGLKIRVLDHLVLLRRIHGENLGIRKRNARSDYMKALKAVLDQRRAN